MTGLGPKGGGAYAGDARKRYERVVDLDGILIGTFNPSAPPPNLPIVSRRDVFNIGTESPSVEAEDWTIYAVPVLPEQWWPTLSDVQAYALQRSPFWLDIDTGVTPERQRVDIPYQGIAVHLAASEIRLGLNVDPGFFNIELPPISLDGRKIAVWARRGRTTATYVTLSSGQNVQGSNVVPIPRFTSLFYPGANGGIGNDRNGAQTFANPAGVWGVSWLTAEIGSAGGFFVGAPSMVAMVIQ